MKITKSEIHNTIKKDCYTRLKPSRVCNGVGVFSIKPIPKNTILFDDVNADTIFFSWDAVKDVDETTNNYLKSICNVRDDGFFLSRTINNINVSYYVNHSETPNVMNDRNLDKFITLCDINSDEEILCRYEDTEKDW